MSESPAHALVTDESEAHEDYKRALIGAGENGTVPSTCFDGFWPAAPHRAMRNSTFLAWDEAGRPAAGERPGDGDVVARMGDGIAIPHYHGDAARRHARASARRWRFCAGMGVAKVTELRPAGAAIEQLAARLAERLNAR